jgi:urease subunit alpha
MPACPLWSALPNADNPFLAMHKMKRSHYADMFGPTTGDKVRLGDTSLIAEVEKDFTVYGDECKFGGGKVSAKAWARPWRRREGRTRLRHHQRARVDYTGIYKADIGIKDGLISDRQGGQST